MLYGTEHVVRTAFIPFGAWAVSNQPEASLEIDQTIHCLSDPSISAVDATFSCMDGFAGVCSTALFDDIRGRFSFKPFIAMVYYVRFTILKFLFVL